MVENGEASNFIYIGSQHLFLTINLDLVDLNGVVLVMNVIRITWSIYLCGYSVFQY